MGSLYLIDSPVTTLDALYVNPRFYTTDVIRNMGLTWKIPIPAGVLVHVLQSFSLLPCCCRVLLWYSVMAWSAHSSENYSVPQSALFVPDDR